MPQRYLIACFFGLLAITQFATPASAQGLLGNGYFDTEFVYYSPHDKDLRSIDSFIPGVQSNLNIPVLGRNEDQFGVDAWGRFRGLWVDGQMDILGVNVDTNIDVYAGAAGANLYYSGWTGFRPWLGVGYEFSQARSKLSANGFTLKDRQNDDGLLLSAGLETTLHEMVAARTSVEWGSNLFNGNSLSKPLFLGEFIISQPTSYWYLRTGGFVDVDGNAGALAGIGVRF